MPSMIKRMKKLEDENRRLKKMYAKERLKAENCPGGAFAPLLDQ